MEGFQTCARCGGRFRREPLLVMVGRCRQCEFEEQAFGPDPKPPADHLPGGIPLYVTEAATENSIVLVTKPKPQREGEEP